MKLTQEGEDLQRSAGDMMLAFESFHRDLRSRVGQRSSVVRISATEGMTKHWLLPRVKELRRRNSRIYLEIISTVNQQSLATSDLDYVIRMGDPGENDLIGKRVADVPMGIFASERYLAGRSAPRSLSELRDHDIIGHTTDFVSFRNVRPNQRDLLEYFSEAAGSAALFGSTRWPTISPPPVAVSGLRFLLYHSRKPRDLSRYCRKRQLR